MQNQESFLGSSYEAPKAGSSYMKLNKGENVIRILSNAVTGFEYWNNENKPIRSKEMFSNTPDIKIDMDGNPTKVKHFWSFVVYNYDTKNIEILQINQKTVQSDIQALVNDADWGNPKGYDIKITRSGEKLETKYSVNPKPQKAVSPEILEKYNAMSINLEALFTGCNPFEKTPEVNGF